MKRKIISILSIATLTLSLTSCLSLDLFDTVDHENTLLEYKFSEDDEVKLDNLITNLKAMSLDDSQYSEFKKKYKDLEKMYSVIATNYNIAYVDYSVDKSKYPASEYLRMSEILGEIEDCLKEVYTNMKASVNKADFFEGTSDEEIDEFIGKKFNDRYYELESENNNIVAQFNDISDPTSEVSKVNELYKNLIKNDNEMATIAGYNSYIDYANDYIYGRDYTQKEADVFTSYVKESIIPLLEKTNSNFNSYFDKIQNKSKEYDQFYKFVKYDFDYFKDSIDGYASKMGSLYNNYYMGLINSNYLYYGDDETYSLDGAYTGYYYNYNTPYIYLGPNYQNTMTFVHEFGHYFSGCTNYGLNGSNDLAESQSQGNEMLYLAFLEQSSYKNKFYNNSFETIKEYNIYSMLETITVASIVYDFENIAHQNTTSVNKTYDEMYKEVCEEYGGYDKLKEILGYNPEKYWKYVAIPHAGYYISYAVSAVPALELYSIATTDFEKAKDIYFKFVYNYDDSLKGTFRDIIVASTLADPFSEEAFDKISAIN